MNDLSEGDLVWVPADVKAHADFHRSLVTKVPRNFLVTQVGHNFINVLIDGQEWTVNRGDVFLPTSDNDEE